VLNYDDAQRNVCSYRKTALSSPHSTDLKGTNCSL